MPFHLTSDQELIRKTVRELAEAELKGKPAEHTLRRPVLSFRDPKRRS